LAGSDDGSAWASKSMEAHARWEELG
jgi:hypothetical protein